MNHRIRFLVFAVLFLTIIVAGTLAFGYFAIRKALPQLEGEMTVVGISGPVKIYRDEYGVPHVYADEESDLMFATGYTQAQDRLWQMDMLRRVASGRLSEIFGTKTIQADKALRTLGFMRMARMISDSLKPETRILLESYADGVNYFIKTHVDNYPAEFTLLRIEPEPWKPEHSMALSRILAWQLSMGWYVDVAYDQIKDSVNYTMFQEIFPKFPESAPLILPTVPEYLLQKWGFKDSPQKIKAENVFPIGQSSPELADFVEANLLIKNILGWEGFAIGSNNWVVDGSHSTTGKPILANDPHLGHGVPSLWYEMHLVGGRFDVTGFTLPGMPFAVLGNNRHVAWGFTNVQNDDADFYREYIKDSTYYFNGAFRPLKWDDEKIAIKDTSDIMYRVRSTHHGPIINDLFDYMNEKAISVRWTGHDVSYEVEAILGMNLATNWIEFRSACSQFKSPAQNVVYADIDGHIAYQFMGNIPIRKYANGIAIWDGTQLENDWLGYWPFEKNPFELDPTTGILSSANNKTAGTWFPLFISDYWEHPSRIMRIQELLHSKEKFSVEDFKLFQNDLYSFHAKEVLPFLLEACQADSLYTKADITSEDNFQYNESYLFLKYWDCKMGKDSRGAALFNVFFQRLLENIYHDDLGELYEPFIKLSNIPARVTTQLLGLKNSGWWNDKKTKSIEDRDAILRRSFNEAIESLVRRFGPEPASWTWEKLHHVTFKHVLGVQKPLDFLFNIGPYPVGGNTTTISNSEFHYSDTLFATVLGASMRRIVDLSDLGHPATTVTIGQSGQPFSPYFKDQVDNWLNGKYKTFSMNQGEIEKTSKLLTLNPIK